jgi:outer membrane protein OmpA-like peptidoglycan-associated protein
MQAYGARADTSPVVAATLYYQKDSAAINPKSENDLKRIQAALEADPATGLRIEGYAHQQGTPRRNHEVAQKRIQAVQQWFLKQGIAKSRLKAKTFVDRKPPVQEVNVEDAMHSERVEVVQISLKQPLAVLPAPVYQFDLVVEGQEVVHAFVVQNKGAAPLKIQRVKTD